MPSALPIPLRLNRLSLLRELARETTGWSAQHLRIALWCSFPASGIGPTYTEASPTLHDPSESARPGPTAGNPADYIINLRPEGGDLGGEVIATGTPEEVAGDERSYTGEFLRHVLPERKVESGKRRAHKGTGKEAAVL